MLIKTCVSCGRPIPYNQKYCAKCSKKAKVQKTENNKQYDKYYRKNKEVYHNPIWIRLTEQCKERYKGLDIYSYYVLGSIEYGSISHHIETVEDCEARRFDIDNLIYLTQSNHAYVHSEYDKSDQDKKAMQELLFSLVERYKKEFNVSDGM